MKNAIRTIISLIRANPEYAKIAITLDLLIGAVGGLVVYALVNAASVSIGEAFILALGSAMFLAGFGAMGYTVLYHVQREDNDHYATDYDVDMDLEREQQ